MVTLIWSDGLMLYWSDDSLEVCWSDGMIVCWWYGPIFHDLLAWGSVGRRSSRLNGPMVMVCWKGQSLNCPWWSRTCLSELGRLPLPLDFESTFFLISVKINMQIQAACFTVESPVRCWRLVWWGRGGVGDCGGYASIFMLSLYLSRSRPNQLSQRFLPRPTKGVTH